MLFFIVDAEDDARGSKEADVIIVKHHAWCIAQQVGGIDGSGNVTGVEDNLSSLTTQDGRLAFYGHAFQCLCLRVHPDGAEIRTVTRLEYGLVSDIGDTDDDGTHITGNDEDASLITHTATDYG